MLCIHDGVSAIKKNEILANHYTMYMWITPFYPMNKYNDNLSIKKQKVKY